MNHSQLERVERTLSPQQAAIHLYQQLAEAKTPAEYSVNFCDVHVEAGLDDRITWVRSSTAASMKGRDADTVWKAQRQAGSEYVFLHSLFGRVNQHACEEWEAWTLRAGYAAILSFYLPAFDLTKPDEMTPAEARIYGMHRRDTLEAVNFLTYSIPIFSGTLKAVERISSTYAGGHPILFQGAIDQLEFGVTCLTLLREGLHDIDMDLEPEPSEATEAVAAALVEQWVDYARADLHEVRGEREEHRKIVLRRVQSLRERD